MFSDLLPYIKWNKIKKLTVIVILDWSLAESHNSGAPSFESNFLTITLSDVLVSIEQMEQNVIFLQHYKLYSFSVELGVK